MRPDAPSLTPSGETPRDRTLRRQVSADRVAFDVVLLIFLGALLLTLPESDSARLVPLLILIPTTLGVAYQLYADLTPGRHAPDASEAEPTPADVRRRQLLFVAWLLTFFVAAWLTSFLFVIPVALFVVFRFGNGESVPVSLALAGGMAAFIFVLFGLVLEVRF